MADLTQKVDLGFVRYANCWEDGELLVKAFTPCNGGRVLSVASGGDNSLLLLAQNPSLVLATDLSQVQLFVTELKREAVRRLAYNDLIEFLGYRSSNRRLKLYSDLKTGLTPSCRQYWDNRRNEIENGIVYDGKFERYFRFFARFIVPLIHSRRHVEELMAVKSEREQATYHNHRWNNTRWKLFFHLFFSRFVLGRAGRDPAFLNEVKMPVARFIYSQASNHLRTPLCQNNFMLRFALTGSFGQLLPPWLSEENCAVVKRNIGHLDLSLLAADDAAATHGPFDRMNLSNIFEYMDARTFRTVAAKLAQGLAKGGRLAYWNLMVPRKVSDVVAGLRDAEDLSRELKKHDRGFFYSSFIVEEKS